MTEFELGMVAGWAAGVVAAGVVAGAFDWWKGRQLVATVHISSVARPGASVCPECNGSREVPWSPVGRLDYRGPRTIPCGGCKGAGVVEADKKAEPCAPVEQDDAGHIAVDETVLRWDPVCPKCQGNGRVHEWDKWRSPGTPRVSKVCPVCKGRGVIKPPPKKP